MLEQNKIKLFVFHYKPGKIIASNSEYVHIWVGKNGANNKIGFTGDDTGINISNKNRYYSELTGLYWIWKNTNAGIVGSNHYRRYFTTVNEPVLYRIKRLLYYPAGLWKKRFGLIYTNNPKFWKSKILTGKEVVSILQTYDAILPVARKLKYSIETHYDRYHNINDLRLIKKIISAEFPEYLDTYKLVLKGNRLFANNMFIFKNETFGQLMKWLFAVLFKFETEINLAKYSGYQERIFGFLAERLITVWIIHNDVSYKELPLIYFKKLKSNLDA